MLFFMNSTKTKLLKNNGARFTGVHITRWKEYLLHSLVFLIRMKYLIRSCYMIYYCYYDHLIWLKSSLCWFHSENLKIPNPRNFRLQWILIRKIGRYVGNLLGAAGSTFDYVRCDYTQNLVNCYLVATKETCSQV